MTWRQDFIQAQRLPESYLTHAEQWFDSLGQKIFARATDAEGVLTVGINGSQGSGKSTLVGYLKGYLEAACDLTVASLSLDDFYHTLETRQQLALTVHPLLVTRGVPGTHDYALLTETLMKLRIDDDGEVALPEFDKAQDDRLDPARWRKISRPVDVILLEGWCLGALPEGGDTLVSPMNTLESEEDSSGAWRSYVNDVLGSQLLPFYADIDYWVMLAAPSFECVFKWRQEQEHKLKAVQADSEAKGRIMDDPALDRFIAHFERLTRHCLKKLPEQVHHLYHLNEQRQVVGMVEQGKRIENCMVFSDLDGSLLDHETYSFEAAQIALYRLKAEGIPLVLVSSKTRAEIEDIRSLLGNQQAFVVENGAGVFLPKMVMPERPEGCVDRDDYWLKENSAPRQHWLGLLEEIGREFPGQYQTFFDADISGIQKLTGLDRSAAVAANRRDYSEPVAWLGHPEDRDRFVAALENAGARVQQGGRFLSVSGDCDKGQALLWLVAQYSRATKAGHMINIAAGDSGNDVAMLEAADTALLIRSAKHDFPLLQRTEGVIKSNAQGPAGWSDGIHQWLESMYKQEHL